MARLEILEIAKSFGAVQVLAPLSLTIESGEMFVLLGPSGCGKSTLLRIVAGLLEATSGELKLDGRRIDALAPAERDVAMVFQNYALYPHMSVADNIGFPLRVSGVSKREIEERVRETTRRLGLEHVLARKPGQLSGGQMQRVALGRALVRRPRLCLYDEPLSNLDAKLRDELRREIGALHRAYEATALYVTHDQVEAMTLGSRIAVLEGGRLHQVGTPMEVFSSPATTFVAGFLGHPPMNLLRGSVRGSSFVLGDYRIGGAPVESGEIVLGLRPEQLDLATEGAHAVVADVERLGQRTLLRVSCGPHRLIVEPRGACECRPGEQIALRVNPAHVHWFDAEFGHRLTPRP